MQIDTDQFRAIREQADEVAALRRTFAYSEILLQETEIRAEARGFGVAGPLPAATQAGTPGPKDGQHGQLRLVSGGRV